MNDKKVVKLQIEEVLLQYCGKNYLDIIKRQITGEKQISFLLAQWFIKSKQFPDGSWQSSAVHTALGVYSLWLSGERFDSIFYPKAIKWLLSQQNSNVKDVNYGSWEGNVWTTSYVLMILAECKEIWKPIGYTKELKKAVVNGVNFLKNNLNQGGKFQSFDIDMMLSAFLEVKEVGEDVAEVEIADGDIRKLVNCLLNMAEELDYFEVKVKVRTWNNSILDTAEAIIGLCKVLEFSENEKFNDLRDLIYQGIEHGVNYILFHTTPSGDVNKAIHQIQKFGWGDYLHTAEALHSLTKAKSFIKPSFNLQEVIDIGLQQFLEKQNKTDGGWFGRVETTALGIVVLRLNGALKLDEILINMPLNLIINPIEKLYKESRDIFWEYDKYKKENVLESHDYQELKKECDQLKGEIQVLDETKKERKKFKLGMVIFLNISIILFSYILYIQEIIGTVLKFSDFYFSHKETRQIW